MGLKIRLLIFFTFELFIFLFRSTFAQIISNVQITPSPSIFFIRP